MTESTNDDELRQLEDELSESDQFNENPPSDLVAFNELRSCADLNRMYTENQLEIDTDFQRQEIWSSSSQTRFIDSLVKQLPIPSLCISYDFINTDRQVVDGRQRIASIVRFLSPTTWKLSKLDDIDKTISNKSNNEIKINYPEIYARVQNTTIPVTVLRCDLSKSSHREYMFTIFHRLNAGGMKLNNQEIRNCIFSGKLNDFLKDAARIEPFVKIFGMPSERGYRFTHEELILRVLSLSDDHKSYRGPLSKHLNAYMSNHRNPTDMEIKRIANDFELTSTIISTQFGRRRKRSLAHFSKAILEAIFVAVLKNLESTESRDAIENRKRLTTLLKDPIFSTDALKDGLSARDKVISRLDRAIEIFR